MIQQLKGVSNNEIEQGGNTNTESENTESGKDENKTVITEYFESTKTEPDKTESVKNGSKTAITEYFASTKTAFENREQNESRPMKRKLDRVPVVVCNEAILIQDVSRAKSPKSKSLLKKVPVQKYKTKTKLPEMTFDVMRDLSKKIKQLHPLWLAEVVRIIQAREERYRDMEQMVDGEVVDVDLELLKPSTLRALYVFVKDNLKQTNKEEKDKDAERVKSDQPVTEPYKLRKRG